MVTASCPRCHQGVDTQAVTCPYCRTPLKAYGHPGIPLHRATGEEFLCDRCTYNADDSCTFPQRPHARECTLFQDISQNSLAAHHRYNPGSFSSHLLCWVKRHQALLLILGLLVVSFLIAL